MVAYCDKNGTIFNHQTHTYNTVYRFVCNCVSGRGKKEQSTDGKTAHYRGTEEGRGSNEMLQDKTEQRELPPAEGSRKRRVGHSPGKKMATRVTFFPMKCTRCSVVRFDQPGCSYCVLCHMLLRRRRAACTQLHSCLFLFTMFCSFEYNILTTDIHKQYSKCIIVLAVEITNKQVSNLVPNV